MRARARQHGIRNFTTENTKREKKSLKNLILKYDEFNKFIENLLFLIFLSVFSVVKFPCSVIQRTRLLEQPGAEVRPLGGLGVVVGVFGEVGGDALVEQVEALAQGADHRQGEGLGGARVLFAKAVVGGVVERQQQDVGGGADCRGGSV